MGNQQVWGPRCRLQRMRREFQSRKVCVHGVFAPETPSRDECVTHGCFVFEGTPCFAGLKGNHKENHNKSQHFGCTPRKNPGSASLMARMSLKAFHGASEFAMRARVPRPTMCRADNVFAQPEFGLDLLSVVAWSANFTLLRMQKRTWGELNTPMFLRNCARRRKDLEERLGITACYVAPQ